MSYARRIDLGGQTRTLRYDGNALFEIEERLGRPIADLADIIVSAKTIRTLLWAGLLHENGALTEKDVGSWIGGGGLPIGQAMEAVGEALSDAFGGEDSDRPTGPPTTAVPGTGESSDVSH